MLQIFKGGLKYDIWVLGKNIKKYFDCWDWNKDG